MENENNEQRLDETTISVTVYEATLISNILQIALNNLRLDPSSRKRVQDFRLKLQRAGLSISKRYLDSLHRIP
jgi:hypothetical protein